MFLSHAREQVADPERASSADPLLRLLDAHRRHKTQTRLSVGEDTHHPCASLDLFVEPLHSVRDANAQPMRSRECEAGEALLDALLQ